MDKQYATSTLNSMQGAQYAEVYAKPLQPAIGRVLGAIESLSMAVNQSRFVADALAGSQPETAGQKLNSVGNGLFDELGVAADRIEAAASSILQDMQRIQNRF